MTEPNALSKTITAWLLEAIQDVGANSYVEIKASHPREGEITLTIATMGGESSAERAARYERLILDFVTPRPYAEWHEKIGVCLWWNFDESGNVLERPYIGTPLDPSWPRRHNYFTPIPEAKLDRRRNARPQGGNRK